MVRWLAAMDFCCLGLIMLVFSMSLPNSSAIRTNLSSDSLATLPHANPIGQRMLQSETLFIIPYGKAPHQIYIHEEGPGEGDYMYIVPRMFRLLPDGKIAFFADREGGSALQVFDQQGRLTRFVAYPEGTGGDVVDIGADGRCYSVTRFMERHFHEALARAKEELEAQTGEPKEQEAEYQLIRSYLKVFYIKAPDGTIDTALLDKLHKDLFQTLKTLDGYFGIGDDIVVTDQGEIYLKCGFRKYGDIYERPKVMRLHPSEAPQIRDALGGGIIRLPNGSLGFIKRSEKTYGVAWEPAEVTIVDVKGQQVARFPIKEELYERGDIRRKLLLVRSDRLALLFRIDSIDDPDASYVCIRPKGLDIDEIWARKYSLVVLDSSGNVVFEDTVHCAYLSPYAADRQGNLYYLHFLPEGVAVKRVRLGEQ